jgi:acyl transferase domain-containing protein
VVVGKPKLTTSNLDPKAQCGYWSGNLRMTRHSQQICPAHKSPLEGDKGQIGLARMENTRMAAITQDKLKVLAQPLGPELDTAVAVIGLGCRFPGSDNPSELWQNILARRQAFRRMPDCRLPLDQYYDADPKTPDKTYLTRAAVLDNFQFDWRAKRIPKSTFDTTDIAHWLALDTALQAMDDAGLRSDMLNRDRSAVIVGNSLTGEQWRANTMRLRWPFVARVLRDASSSEGIDTDQTERLIKTAEQSYKSVFAQVDEDTLAGSLSNTIAGRICNYLDLHGGGYTVDGACSSSLLAVITAAKSLNLREVDLVIAGGVDVSLDTFELIGFAKTGAFSATEARVYDRRASGFLPGEGCGFVVLKRLEDARRDGNYVYAVLRGWGIASDGKGGITAPSKEGQALAIGRAYAMAGYSMQDLDFIEGHGTGTRVGDEVELGAIAMALGRTPEAIAATGRTVGVTSLKSLIGHTKAAAGAGGLIKAVLAVHRRVVPPTANCQEPHAIFEGQAQRLYPVLHGQIADTAQTLRAGVSAMGFGGINTHVTLESGDLPDSRCAPFADERTVMAHAQQTELLLLASNSTAQLIERMRQVQGLAHGISVAELADLSAELVRELDGDAPVRAAFVAESPEQFTKQLSQLEVQIGENRLLPVGAFVSPCQRYWVRCQPTQAKPRIAFLFPGQGVQPLGMGRFLVERFDWARELVGQADAWLQHIGSPLVSSMLFRNTESATDERELDDWRHALVRTEVAQPTITLISLLWHCYLTNLGIHPNIVAGHSLGELAALYAAGAFDVKTLIELAARRGLEMGKAAAGAGYEGGMASLRCTKAGAMELIKPLSARVVLANHNSEKQVVISGDAEAVALVMKQAETNGVRATKLAVSAAFHSPQMRDAMLAMRDFEGCPKSYKLGSAQMLSAVSGSILEPNVDLREYLAQQVCAPVEFANVSARLAATADIAIEVGPGRVLCGLVLDTLEQAGPRCLPMESRPEHDLDRNLVLAALFAYGVNWNWDRLHDRRLIEPFLPISARHFIENPCERPFKPATMFPVTNSARNRAEDSGTLESILAAAGLSQSLSRSYVKERGPYVTKLLAKLVEVDLEAHPLETAVETALLAPISARELAPASASPQQIRVASQQVSEANQGSSGPLSAEATVLSLVAERTGFPIQDLDLNLRMLDDLHLDSIKTAELISRATRALGLSGQIDPTTFANATLGKVTEALLSARAAQPRDPAPPTSSHSSLGGNERGSMMGVRYPAWTRNFNVVWKPLELSLATAASAISIWNGRRVSLLSEPGATRENLAALLRETGALVSVSDFHSELDPQADATDIVVVFPNDSVNKGDAQSRLKRHIERVCDAVKRLPRQSDGTASVTWLRSEPGPQEAGYWSLDSFAASLHLERPWLKFRALTFARNVGTATLFQALSQEQVSECRFARARYSGDGQRWVPRPQLHLQVEDTPRATRLGVEDVVLITGGAKGITAECALAMGKETGATLVLVGSSPVDSVLETLVRFEREGVRCKYERCDLTNSDQVSALIDRVTATSGKITAVLHGAGLNRPAVLRAPLADEALQEIGPKLVGALHLFRAFESSPPRLFAALTSVIGYSGMAGNAWYAFANECLDLELGGFSERHPETDTFSIAYSAWSDIGMAAKLGTLDALMNMGVDAVAVEQGVQRFVHLLTHDSGVRQELITGRLGNLDTWDEFNPKLPTSARFLDRILICTPGVELLTQIHLNLEQDPYLNDHCLDGSYLFPAVFGIEAMAQAVAYVTQRFELLPLHIDQIVLERPIVVDPENGLDIHIRAMVLEASEPGAPQRVAVQIRTAESGFQRDHFSAVFVLSAPSAADRQPDATLGAPGLGLGPARDLYGSVLFQGPSFQRIRQLFDLDTTHCTFTAEQRPSAEWLLGDPYFRDALLQSAQLSVTPNMCLPLRIERWDMWQREAHGVQCHRCVTAVEELEPGTYRATVQARDEMHRMVESLTGYDCRILQHREHLPPPSEIVLRGTSEAVQARLQLGALCEPLGLGLPELGILRLPGIHRLNADVRHQAESPLMTAVTRAALNRCDHSQLTIRFSWDDHGRPNIDGTNQVSVSLAHDEEFCVCVAGQGPQGCDIEPVIARASNDWSELLGPTGETLCRRLRQIQSGNNATSFLEPHEDGNRLRTLLWATAEALRKATGSNSNAVVGWIEPLRDYDGNSLIVRLNGGSLHVVSSIIELGSGPPHAIAAVVSPPRVETEGNRASAPVDMSLMSRLGERTQATDDNPFVLMSRN